MAGIRTRFSVVADQAAEEEGNQRSEVSGQRSEGVFERRKPGRRTEESAFALVIG
jgi:hypothetical protein